MGRLRVASGDCRVRRAAAAALALLAASCLVETCLAQAPLQFFDWTSVGTANSKPAYVPVVVPGSTDSVYVTMYNYGYASKVFPTNGAYLVATNWGATGVGSVSMAVDLSSNVWVVDYGDGLIHEFSPQGALVRTVSSSYQPRGIAVDHASNVWLAGYGTVLARWATNYATSTTYSDGGYFAYGICVDKDNNVWVNNSDTKVTKFSASNGYAVTYYPKKSSGSYGGCCMDKSNNFWAAQGNYVCMYDATNSYARTDYLVSAGVCFDMACDANNDIWVVSNDQGKMYRMPSGSRGTVTTNSYVGVYSVCVDNLGNVWAPSVSALTVRKYHAEDKSVYDEYPVASAPVSITSSHFIWWW